MSAKRPKVTPERVAVVMKLRDGDMHDPLELAYCSGLDEEQVSDIVDKICNLEGPAKCMQCGVRLNAVPCLACKAAGRYPRYQPAAEREPTGRVGEYEYPTASAKD